jgi:hypothetical protein
VTTSSQLLTAALDDDPEARLAYASAIVHDDLDRAIDRGRRMVLPRQRDDGSWQERGDMGPFTTALALVSLHHLGATTRAESAEGTRWLRARQLADGSFPGRPFARAGDLSATAAAWAALSLSDQDVDREAAERVRTWVDEHGGVDAVLSLASSGDVAAVVLAMANVVRADRLSTAPLSIVLVPSLAEILSRRIVFYGRHLEIIGGKQRVLDAVQPAVCTRLERCSTSSSPSTLRMQRREPPRPSARRSRSSSRRCCRRADSASRRRPRSGRAAGCSKLRRGHALTSGRRIGSVMGG